MTPRQMLAAAVAAIIAGLILWASWERAGRHQALALRTAERAAHAQTQANVRTAMVEAQQRATDRARAIEAEQARITQEVDHEYQTRLADLRTRVERLRAQAAAAAAGGAGRSDVPGPAAPAGGADAAPPQAGLLAAGMSLDDRALATKQALQLDALIDWVERQGSVIAPPRRD